MVQLTVNSAEDLPLERERWNLKELREHIRTLPKERKVALAFVTSLDWADRIFKYHFCEARDALRSVPIDEDPNSIKNHELMFSSTDEHEFSMLVIRANVTACIHTARNAYDHLAQLCNVLLLDPPMSVESCDFHRVRRSLPESELRNKLDLLAESDWFQYIAAYSNTSKHRMLVQQSLHLSYADGIAGIRAESFEHDKAYPSHMVGDLLEGILEVKNQIIICGRTLNDEIIRGER